MVTVSESSRQDLLDFGFKRIFTVSEGLNFEPLNGVPEKENYPVIAYVGRLRRAKRPDHVVKAFKTVKESLPSAEFWIIGNGDFRVDLERMACDGVKFFENVSNEERRNLLKRAWVLVNPSVREGFGLNIIEANALGTPCIAYNVNGLKDSVRNGETGLLVKSGDTCALAEEIIRFLGDDRLRDNFSKNALVYSRAFSWDRAAEEFMSIIKEIFSSEAFLSSRQEWV
jgi:glycosyltransferase involved in cell wall biosynthesis